MQLPLFKDSINFKKDNRSKLYSSIITVSKNKKGVLEVDTVKGCTSGMMKYPNGGCYGECYANKIAVRYGFDFTKSITRRFLDREHAGTVRNLMNYYKQKFYRIGVNGDPCHDWENIISICYALRHCGKVAVIVTKHWIELTDDQLERLRPIQLVFNTSTSGMDSDDEIKYRAKQISRIREAGFESVNRVVTCNYGKSEWSKICNEKQEYLMSIKPIIDNPFRPSRSNEHVLNNDILVENRSESIGGGKLVSLNNRSAYLEKCDKCQDQCGINKNLIIAAEKRKEVKMIQAQLFEDKIEFIHVDSVIGSGYEQDVAKLALEDGIAHRAARKNMQIHSAIILLINNEFAGFFTFQNNDEVKEFCLLQSVIKPDLYTDELYKSMVLEVIDRNYNNYPALITTNPKSKFETPKLFESIGFETYLKMSGFCYMVHGRLSDVRLKLLAHITMTNVWHTTKADWLRIKKEWKVLIDNAGEKHSIPNPNLATREGCWQGESGFANVVTGRSHNKNASVLDPVACEIILRFFMPIDGKRVYNPFGGGVQFGFITGYYGYEYVASEIRKNQCDANNLICSEFKDINWIQSDSSTYQPDGMFDLVFCCPPYYKVEKYLDYDGLPPDGEINAMSSYIDFRAALFSGYKIAIDHLNDNCFFVIMVGDSRDNKGAYYCTEAETELFLKENGLSIYNKIIFLESEFTRLAQAKKTLNMRKFPKCEQKIIVAFKGDMTKIKDLYIPVGRL